MFSLRLANKKNHLPFLGYAIVSFSLIFLGRWGNSDAMSNWEHDGAHLKVEPHLKNLQDFCSTDRSFAASLTTGQVFAWGHPETGGSNRHLQKEIWKM